MTTREKKLMWLMLSIAISVAVYWLLPISIGELTRRSIAITVAAALMWATEAMPLYATSLCVVGLEILLLATDGGGANWLVGRGVIPEDQELSYTIFLAPFASPIIILFMGGFLLSAAVTRHHLDRAIAARILMPFAHGPCRLMMGVMILTAFFSMWMSNTATTVMMLAIVEPLIRSLGKEQQKFGRGLVLSVAFAANIGGIGTPIGTPPNAVVLAALHQAGHPVAFVEWMMMAVPLMLMLLVAAGVILYLLYKPVGNWNTEGFESDPQAIDWRGKLTLVILAFAIVMWLTGKMHGLAPAAVALLAAAALTAMSVLDRRDVDSIDWNVLILMWGGLSMGVAMKQTGVIQIVVDAVPTGFEGFALAALVMVLGAVLSTFISNTATAIILVPMVIALPGGHGVELAILTGLACSFAMAMPVSTPPNAIAFASGRLTSRDLLRSGILIGVIGLILMLLGYQIILPLTIGNL